MKKLLSTLLILFTINSFAQTQKQQRETETNSIYSIEKNINYYNDSISQSDEYIKERCVLDIYFPKNIKSFPTIVWFHGGGIQTGNKEIPEALKNKGGAIVAVNYRLHPKVKSPKYIEDAAAAVAWVFQNINKYGGDSSSIFVSGHSAGGYIACMVGMDKRWLSSNNIDANRIAGIIPFSGHTITHFTIRKERGIDGNQPIIDDLAPLFHVRPDASPLVLITGDRELELLGRYEENAYMIRMMKVNGHKNVRIHELAGYDHGGMAEPAFPLMLKEIERLTLDKGQ